MRIGLLSDTHLPASIADLDRLGPQVAEVLSGVDLILHSGDVILPVVLDDHSRLAYAEVHSFDGPFPWEGERPPWQIVDAGMTERFLLREMDKHERLKRTIPCPPPELGCKLCGVC